ncbi:MAG TPA: ATPase [Sphingomicrobium sp.]|nr:ATPase [Sphingomicrobium sp.]
MRANPLIVLSILSAPASGAVVSASDHGFEVQNSVNLVVPQDQAFASFGQVGKWWDDQHTYSGDGKRMSLQMRPGGCFCEPLESGGGVEHMRVAFVQPGERIVLTGSLGPLLYEATSGVMDVKVERIAGGSRVTMNYRAAGFANGGAAAMAPLVDQVLAEQLKRYRAYAAGAPKPDTLKP